jgi:hypothetical protein
MLSHVLRASIASSYDFPQIIFGAGAFDLTDQNSTTFSSLAIGPALPTRKVLVCVSDRVGLATYVSPATVTVAGQSCSVIAQSNGVGSPTTQYILAGIYITDAEVTSGTTANVVVTVPSGETMSRCYVSTYAITKNSALSLDQAIGSSAATNPSTQTSTLQTGQAGILLASAATTSGLSSMSLTGPLTSNYSSGVQEFGIHASAVVIGAGTCTATTVGTGSIARTVLATWS